MDYVFWEGPTKKRVQNRKKLQKPHFTPCLVIRQIFGKKRVAELCYFSVAVEFRNQPEDDGSEEWKPEFSLLRRGKCSGLVSACRTKTLSSVSAKSEMFRLEKLLAGFSWQSLLPRFEPEGFRLEIVINRNKVLIVAILSWLDYVTWPPLGPTSVYKGPLKWIN